ncbi:TolC family protein [Chryseobacterium lactis]|uniref:TolC family protein n=1 Tax=Chryseobacterium lactis TaxID=1241981 RepID=A0A3G6RM75_CHRLC|nr:TolC family protein [Chryseobacterium lactis]AZA83702.1 TolC family protein [Chryseobacterium lactis]AZB04087.1 TolC family protein [Chryseobacterium lactis]PNW13005.1 TolC family protein [Chryseobacterium lactis]
MCRNIQIHLIVLAFLSTAPSITLKAQTSKLTLEECYRLAKENYPMIKKLGIITKTADYTIENANKSYLPQISFAGQATYQSQTISFSDVLGSLPISTSLPSLSKDQYKIQGEVDQILYDGGVIHHQKALTKANAELQTQNIETSLYALRQKINTLFFSILLMDAQLKQNQIKKNSLETQVQKAEAALQYGTAYRSNVDELKAEVVNTEMTDTEYSSNRKAYLTMLAVFIGQNISGSSELESPDQELLSSDINRPELKAFDLQKSIYNVQEQQLKSDLLPKVSAFFQGAYGRPTLNIIENKFGPWFITGLRFSWSLESLYTSSNKKSILELNRKAVDTDRETFLFTTKMDLSQQNEDVKKYNELLKQDETVINLRRSVTKSAEAQLANGVITTHEYIQKLNTEHLAAQTMVLHQIQLLQAKYNQKFISGN